MRTEIYNPSQLEVEFANALNDLVPEIEKKLSANKIIKIENKIKEDNPMVLFHLQDTDGDLHELVIKLIQRPDKF